MNRNRKGSTYLALCLATTLCLAGCRSEGGNITLTTSGGNQSANAPATLPEVPSTATDKSELDIKFTKFDLDASVPTDAVRIELSNGGTSCTSEVVKIDGSCVTIGAGGDYIISGSLTDGQLIVDVGESEKVKLCLDGVSISSADNAPIEIISADKVMIVLCDGSTNTITDSGVGYIDSDEDADNTRRSAAIYSKCALTIGGGGSLNVTASYHDGIRSKKVLKIIDGVIGVTSSGSAIKGSNGVAIAGGKLVATADENCIRTSEEIDTTKGYIYIKEGTLDLTAKKHGISASQYVIIEGGTIGIVTSGTEVDTDDDTSSSSGDRWGRPGGMGGMNSGSGLSKIKSKGIKADKSISISGGSINISSTGHAISSGGAVSISGETTDIVLHAECTSPKANSKGIKADGDLTITDGNVNVTYSYEGLESKGGQINISGGHVKVFSTDDGFNAASNDGSIVIGGGEIFVNASGDGFDSNGNIYFTGGKTLIAGPTSSADGALDCGDNRNYISISGGLLIAYGASGMAEAPSSEYSSQCSISSNVSITKGDLCALANSDGEVICAFVAAENAQNVVVSSPDIKIGEKYTLSLGGTLSGADNDETIYVGGKIDGAKSTTEITISSITTGGSGGFGGMGGMGGFGGGGGHGENGDRPDGMGGNPPDIPSGDMGGNPPDMGDTPPEPR